MNDLPRQKLFEVVKRYGVTIIEDARRCESLMRDNFPAHRREIAVLSTALENRIPHELLNARTSHTPRTALLIRLAQRLQDDSAIEINAAHWAVRTWALALEVITPDELHALEHSAQQLNARESMGQVTAPAADVVQTASGTTANTSSRLPTMATPVTPTPNEPQAGASNIASSPVSPHLANSVKPSASVPHNISGLTGSSSQSVANKTLIVAADGRGDFVTIAEAILHAPDDAHVVIRPGIYTEGLTISKNIHLIGDGTPEQIIIQAFDSSVVTSYAERATLRNVSLRGRAGTRGAAFFTVDIPRGGLLIEACDITSDSLSCVAIHNPEAAPLIKRSRIHDSNDSGVFAFNGASGTIESCDVFANRNINVALTTGAYTEIKNCHIHDGADAGLVIWNQASSEVSGCEIYANAKTNIGVSDEAVARVRECRIYTGANTGIYVHRGGQATVESCDIYAHRESEIAVTSSGDISLTTCRIYRSALHGLYVGGDGQATVEGCELFDNRESGAHTEAGGVLIARQSKFNRNGHVGISCEAGGAVDVADCDLTLNRIAAWQTDYGSQVVTYNNRL